MNARTIWLAATVAALALSHTSISPCFAQFRAIPKVPPATGPNVQPFPSAPAFISNAPTTSQSNFAENKTTIGSTAQPSMPSTPNTISSFGAAGFVTSAPPRYPLPFAYPYPYPAYQNYGGVGSLPGQYADPFLQALANTQLSQQPGYPNPSTPFPYAQPFANGQSMNPLPSGPYPPAFAPINAQGLPGVYPAFANPAFNPAMNPQ